MKKFNHGKMITIMTLIMAMLFALAPQMQQEAYAATKTWPQTDFPFNQKSISQYHGPKTTNENDSCIGLRSYGSVTMGNFYDKQRTFELYFRRYLGNNVEDDNPTTGLGYGSAANIGGSILGGKGLNAAENNSLGDGVNVAVKFTGLENKKIIRVRYEITNNSSSSKKVTLGGTVPFKLDRSEKSRAYSFGNGLLLKAPTGVYLAFQTDGNYWWGTSSINDVEGKKYLNAINRAKNYKGRASDVTEGASIQAGLSWLWESVEVPANSTVNKDCYFGIGAEALGDNPYEILMPESKATVKWDANNPGPGSISGMPDNNMSGTDENGEVVLPDISCANYSFEGWYDKPAGGNKVGETGSKYHTEKDVTLYAHWKAVVSTVNIQLKMDEDPYKDQVVQLYSDWEGKDLKYTLSEKNGDGTYTVGGVKNGTYRIFINGRTVRFRDDLDLYVNSYGDESTWVKNRTVTLDKVSITTNLDGNKSNSPGAVTLRQGGNVIYDFTNRGTGEWSEGLLFNEGDSYDVYVGGKDTGRDISKNEKSHEIDFYIQKVSIEDDEAWEDAEVTLKDSDGKIVDFLKHQSSEGKVAEYSALILAKDEDYSIFVNGVDTGKKINTKQANNVDLKYFTAKIKVNCSDAKNLALSAKMTGDGKTYTFKKDTSTETKVEYTSKHIPQGTYKLSVSGVSKDGIRDFDDTISTADPTNEYTAYVVNFKKYETPDNNKTFEAKDSGVKTYVFNGAKAKSVDSVLSGFTFTGWSEAEWTLSETGYNAFNFSTGISEDKTLYPHFLSPSVKINGFARTKENGDLDDTGDYYRMPNLTISGFDTGNESIRYVMFETENVDSIIAKNPSSVGANFDADTKILEFTTPVSMNVARDYVRENIIVEPSKTESGHKAGDMKVTVVDKNGTMAKGYDGGEVTPGFAMDSLTGTAGQVLTNNKMYKLESDMTINGTDDASDSRGRSGLIVDDNATVYLYIPDNITLTVNGANADGGGDGELGQSGSVKNNKPIYTDDTGAAGSGGIGAGAGIYLPSGAKLYLLGQGTINATGGAAGAGGNGGNGALGGSGYVYPPGATYYVIGGGGGAGGGGGGAAAGIGGSGGNGGNGGNGAPRLYTSNNDIGVAGDAGVKGSDGASFGALYNGGVRINAIGGAASSTGGTGGAQGGNSNPIQGGSGGGGGGAGLSAQGIGSGGGGAGGGSGGCRSCLDPSRGMDYRLGEGGKPGTGNANGTKGEGGKYMSAGYAVFSKAEGTKGAASSAKSAQDVTGSFSITFNNANGEGTVGPTSTTTYTYGSTGSIEFPDFTPKDGQIFNGWKITGYAVDLGGNDNNPMAEESETLYAAGSTAEIVSGTFGDLVFSPVTLGKSGLSAEDTDRYKGTTTPVNVYTVKTKVDGELANVGTLSFRYGATTEVNTGTNGEYELATTSSEVEVLYKGEVVATLTADDNSRVINFETVRVKVIGKETSEVTLEEGGPALSLKSSDSANKTYTFESDYRVVDSDKGEYPILVDGEETKINAKYGSETEVKYHTIVVDLSPSEADTVTLQDKDGNVLIAEKNEDGTFSYTSLEDTKTDYDIYADGTPTSATGNDSVEFDGNSDTVTAGYYVAKVSVKLDNNLSDEIGVPSFGKDSMIRKDTGTYTYAAKSEITKDVSINGEVVIENMKTGESKTVNYYSLTYKKNTGEEGTAPEKTICVNGGKKELAFNTLRKDNLKFAGWEIDGKVYEQGEEISITKKTEANATWVQNSLNDITDDGKTGRIVIDNAEFTYNGTEQKPDIKVFLGDLELGEDDYTVSFENDNNATEAGADTVRAGKVTITVQGKGNYSGKLTEKYEIIPKAVSISGVTAEGREYDGTNAVNLNRDSVTIVGAVEGDDLSVKWADETKGEVADKNVITISDEDLATLDSDDPIREQIETVDGTNYVKKDVSLETDEEGDIKASLDGAKKSNYVLTNVDEVKAVIKKKEIDVTANAQEKFYGEKDPDFTYDEGALVEGDSFSGELARVSGEDVGDYDINQGSLTAGDNYNITYKGAKLTIKRKDAEDLKPTQKEGEHLAFDNGKPQKPTIVIHDDETGKDLEEGKDFTVTYEGVDPTEYESDEAPSEPGTYKAIITFIGNYDGEPKELEFTVYPKVDDLLLAQMTAKGKKAMTIRWTRVEGADGYDIFFSKCNTKGKKYTPKLIKTVRGNGTFKFTKKKLKKKVAYKAYVRAFKMEGGRKQYISTSMMYHGFTSGYKGKYTDAKSVTVNRSSVSLNRGGTFRVTAGIKKVKPKKLLIKTSHAPHLRYVSSNNYIATVDGNGVITAKSGGTCYVYAVATNGVRSAVQVTVK